MSAITNCNENRPTMVQSPIYIVCAVELAYRRSGFHSTPCLCTMWTRDVTEWSRGGHRWRSDDVTAGTVLQTDL